MFGLIDCNNFFVSCERTLDKSIEGKPVVVLSNNDGCFISRSDEAKKLGLPMGGPYFKYKSIIRENGVHVFSAKFEYYNFKSQQIINEVKTFFPEVEVYSIDEVFFNLKGFERFYNVEEYCQDLRLLILKNHKIPTSIGLAPTKTLAKLANRIAKKYSDRFNHMYIMDTEHKIEKALKWLPIEDVWGIGRQLSCKLKNSGVHKAYDLLEKPELWIKQIMGIQGVRLIRELKGIPQLEINKDLPIKQSIATTRSFMDMLSDKEMLRGRLKTFSFSCSEKLRKQNSCCNRVTIFIRTNRFREDLGSYFGSQTYVFPNPTSSSVIISKAVDLLFDEIYKDGYSYKKAGVIVSEFVPENERLINLFEKDVENIHSPVMKAIDILNKKYGKNKIRLASQNGKSIYERKILSKEYEEFLNNNTLPEANFRFQ